MSLSSRCRGLICDCGIFMCLSCPLGSGEPFRSSKCGLLSCGCVICLFLAVPWLGHVCGIFLWLSCPLKSGEPFRSSSYVLLSCGSKCYMSLPRGAVAWSVILTFSCTSHAPWDQVSPSGLLVMFCCRVAVSVICLSLRGAVAWSVIVAFSCASHAPWDQVSPSGPLVVFYCRAAVLYVSSLRCHSLSVIGHISLPFMPLGIK